jgi:putative ABC transport system permease protein
MPAARRSMALVVRTAGPATSIVAPIRRIINGIDPAIPMFGIAPMSEVVRASTARLSLTLTMMTAAAIITLVLGMIGMYGVMTYMVGLRTRELGIRLALGADPRALAKGVAFGGLALLAGGVGAGFLLYALAVPMLRGFLYGVSAVDPIALAAATGILVVTAALASWLPARRAAQVDPTVAMRAD